MESLHEPDNRSWISKEIKPKQILDKYQERVEAYKPSKGANEANLRPFHLQQMVNVDDEIFKDLEEAMEIENLTTEGEPCPMQVVNPNWAGGVYGIAIPKFNETPIPEAGRLSLRTLYVQAEWNKRARKENPQTKDKNMMASRKKELLETNDNLYLSQPPRQLYRGVFSDNEHLYTIKVYRPFVHPNIAIKDTFSNKDLTLAQEIWVLGEQTLADFRDKITCSIDNNFVGKQQVDTLDKLAPRAGDVYKSGFIFINDCFYLDTRHKDNIDYSQVIIDWASRSNRGLGPFKKGVMETTKFEDLEFRVGYPYVFTHQGNHEHLFCITDVRLVGPDDPQSEKKYPLIRSVGNQQSRMCMVCQIKIATWVTVNNSRVAENPFFFCTLCYKSFNLKVDGSKEGEFAEYRYHDVNSV